MPTSRRPSPHNTWWEFIDTAPHTPATGAFRAHGASCISRLYFPLVNEAGMLSWTSPQLHGSPAISHHHYLAPPLTTEELPHTLLHRDAWLVETDRPPVSLSGLSPDGLAPSAHDEHQIDAGIGWWTLTRRDPQRRWIMRATLWCPADIAEPLEIMHITVENISRRPLRALLYAATPLFGRSADNIRDHRHVTVLLHRIHLLRHGVVLQPTMSFDERGHILNTTQYAVLAFGPRGNPPSDIWAHEENFLGEGGTWAAPTAVWNRARAPRYRQDILEGREAVGAFRFAPIHLAAGEKTAVWLVSGIAQQPHRAQRWMTWAARPRAVEQSLTATRSAWQAHAQRVIFSTADRTLNQWLCWVTVQPVFRRLYGNSYLPQFDYGRGGRGWRDLWQDGLALMLYDPRAARSMLTQHIAGVRVDGSNATIIARDGSFVADRNNIPRTWMDHGVWPLHTILRYVDQTGDTALLFKMQTYFRDPQVHRCRQVDSRWTPSYGVRLRTTRGRLYRGSMFEHVLVQTLTAFFNVGEHNLCRLEGADWNDGLDMAAARGESVAFSAFYAWNLKRLADLLAWLKTRGSKSVDVFDELLLLLDRLPGQRPVAYHSAGAKRQRLEHYLQTVSRDISGRRRAVDLDALAKDLLKKYDDLAQRIRKQEWITARGTQFFNGYYDDLGRRVEGAHGSQVRMTLTGQVFPVMSGIATGAQVGSVIRAVNRWLRDPNTGGIRLNTNFGEPQPHLGRAFFFAYGDKENGAVFSHMAVMYAAALYARRRPEEGRAVWGALYRMATNQSAAKIFPSLPEYFNREGRGLYTYLTGSASWLISLLLTHVFGIRGERGDLVIDPQLTREDFGAAREISVETSFAGRRLRFRFANPQRLPPRQAIIGDIRVDDRLIPFRLRPEGGVLIDRRLIEQLPAARPHILHLTLTR